ncbi:MAG: hypothetical protein V2J42_00525 [Wenzhouxiangella sp.]|nr:hypothetical protein [Wenzhouxiangella sp.]
MQDHPEEREGAQTIIAGWSISFGGAVLRRICPDCCEPPPTDHDGRWLQALELPGPEHI